MFSASQPQVEGSCGGERLDISHDSVRSVLNNAVSNVALLVENQFNHVPCNDDPLEIVTSDEQSDYVENSQSDVDADSDTDFSSVEDPSLNIGHVGSSEITIENKTTNQILDYSPVKFVHVVGRPLDFEFFMEKVRKLDFSSFEDRKNLAKLYSTVICAKVKMEASHNYSCSSSSTEPSKLSTAADKNNFIFQNNISKKFNEELFNAKMEQLKKKPTYDVSSFKSWEELTKSWKSRHNEKEDKSVMERVKEILVQASTKINSTSHSNMQNDATPQKTVNRSSLVTSSRIWESEQLCSKVGPSCIESSTTPKSKKSNTSPKKTKALTSMNIDSKLVEKTHNSNEKVSYQNKTDSSEKIVTTKSQRVVRPKQLFEYPCFSTKKDLCNDNNYNNNNNNNVNDDSDDCSPKKKRGRPKKSSLDNSTVMTPSPDGLKDEEHDAFLKLIFGENHTPPKLDVPLLSMYEVNQLLALQF